MITSGDIGYKGFPLIRIWPGPVETCSRPHPESSKVGQRRIELTAGLVTDGPHSVPLGQRQHGRRIGHGHAVSG